LVVSSTYFSSSFVSQKISWHRLLLFQFTLFLLTDKLTRSTARWQHSTSRQNWLQRVVLKKLCSGIGQAQPKLGRSVTETFFFTLHKWASLCMTLPVREHRFLYVRTRRLNDNNALN
jgi:hypothetical protein